MGSDRGTIDELLNQTRVLEIIGKPAWDVVRRAFAKASFEPWTDALALLVSEDLGPSAILAFAEASPVCARLVGPDAAVASAHSAVIVHRHAGRRAATMLLRHAPQAARRFLDGAAFNNWLAVIEEIAALAPESAAQVLERTDTILARLDTHAFRSWALTGVRASAGDATRRAAFFSFDDPAALRAFERAAAEIIFSDVERRMRAYMTALWGGNPIVRTAIAKADAPPPRRIGFQDMFVRVPETYPGFSGPAATRIFRAALAHVGAHMSFTKERFPLGSLKSVQVALVSLIEDARVEALAAREFPGLGRLWASFHVAEPHGAFVAEALMARLARALIDPDYRDDDPWVGKGREMFFEERQRWHDQSISRTIGGLLGNDLGQMRIQFNPKTYVVEPPYRDDSLGIWDFGDSQTRTSEDMETVYDAVRIERRETDEEEHRRTESQPEQGKVTARPRELEEDAGVPIAKHPEWDHIAGHEHTDWTTIMEFEPTRSSAEIIDRVLDEYPDVVNRLTKLIQTAKIARPTRVRRQPEGDRLDLEAVIRAAIDWRVGVTPDARVYERSEMRSRDLSVLVLLDISESTKEFVKGTMTTVLSLEKTATALLAHVMAGLGDPFAIHAFCSNGRNEVRYVRVKDFNNPYGPAVKARLAGLRGGLSTRMGAALRHAGSEIAARQSHRRLVLIVTDGEPSDVDVPDRKYLVEDARKAVQGLAHAGIDVFCVGLDSSADSYLPRIFGRRNFVRIDKITSLPQRLPMLYLRLTT
jgi:uncharacterized protein YegL